MGESHDHLVTNWSASNFSLKEGFGYHFSKLQNAFTKLKDTKTLLLSSNELELSATQQRMLGIDPCATMVFVGRVTSFDAYKYPGRIVLNTMYESTRIPSAWVDEINLACDIVVVPSPWLVDVFKNCGITIPVHMIQEGVDPEDFKRIKLLSSDTPYTFMCIADRGSRKGFDLVYQAFYKAFKGSKHVRLITKAREDSIPQFQNGSIRNANFWRYDAPNMSDVYNVCDCFIFPSRGEGYGLPPRETAVMGIPTIALAAHGTFDVENWGIPLKDFKMIPCTGLPGGGEWFQPDIDEIAEKMTWCFENQREAKTLATKGKKWLTKNQTWEQSAQKFYDLITWEEDYAKL